MCVYIYISKVNSYFQKKKDYRYTSIVCVVSLVIEIVMLVILCESGALGEGYCFSNTLKPLPIKAWVLVADSS